MPGHYPVRLSPADPKTSEPVTGLSLPRAVLLTLNLDEGAQPGGEGAEQSFVISAEAAPQEQPAAAFPQDENSPVTVYFVADTAFDCDDAGCTAEWPSCED